MEDITLDGESASPNDVGRCLVCSSGAFQKFADGCLDRYLGTGSVVDFRQCSVCGLVQQYPLPDDLAPLYEEYPMHKARSGLYSLSRRTLMSSVYLDPAVWGCGTALLDFGCGDGWYLDWCRARGVEAIGFEPGAGYASSLSERIQSPVFSGLDELLELRRASFDVVTMHFVVEHLVDIRGALMSASELLKPGGIIRYVVPNIDSWEYRLFGQYWHSLDPPRHISFPDGGHARRLAEELGMEFLKEESVAFPNGFGGSIPTFLLGRFNAALFFLTLPLSLVVTRLFPSGNRAYWMRRPT